MAKTIEDLIVKLKAEGFENIDKLKGAFRGLANVTNATETQLAKTRKEIIDFGKESTNSIAVIKGQIAALKGLQQQADINGTTFKKLKADVKAYEAQLKSAEAQLDSFNTKVQSIASIQSGFEKLGVPGLESQLSKRQKSLAQQTPLTNEYVTALGGVIKVETALTRLYERQNVIAASARTVKFTPARGGTQDFDVEGLIRYAGVFQTLPNTNAAYAQVLKEVRQDLANVDRGTEDYLNTLLRLTYIQRDASRVTRGFAQSLVRDLDTGRAARSAQNLEEAIGALRAEMAQLDTTTSSGSAEYARNASAANRLQRQLDAIAQSYKAVSTNAAQATNAQTSYANAATVANYFNRPAARAAEQARAAQTMPMPPREISSLYNQIGQIGMQPILGNIEMMGNSYETVANDIRKATAASDGSINSLQAQRAAWENLRNTLGDNKLALREVDKELTQIDQQLVRRGRGGGRLSGMQLAQGVGAALSGGIFGGPEGLIGGLGGLAVGGVGGAFAGAAFGAQVGMVRQQLGVFTEQAAAISKLRIGLASVSTDLREFEASTRAVEGASQSLLIPLADTYRYYTQLRASTVELNYSANDTRQILEGTASAVLKTGGSLADVDGAMRAVVQILSKGKAAAEEVRGQLGERFPGAVIKFAQANKMSVQELDQAFQAGSVTIEQFITFARKNYEDGGKYVENLSNSTEYAGKRMEKALENLRLAVGRSLKESGASFQNFAADAAESLLWLGQQLSAFGDAAERALGGIPGPTGNAKEIAERIIGGGTTVAAVEEAIRAYEEKVKEAKDRLNAVKTRNIFQFIFDETFGQGTPTQQQTDRSVSSFESRIQSLREALKLANEYTRRGKPGAGSGSEDPAAADRAKSLLSAIEQREEALTQARIQREEQIADIRKQSIEQARQLERQFADERRNLEREIATTKRGITDVEEDIARQRRLLAGEDPRLIEAEQRVADVYREAREKDIKAKEDYADREFNRARTIADFQKNVADQINKANEAYARQIGKIHRGYATDVGKILDEASGKTAKRLSIAVKLMDAFRELDMLQSARFAVGLSPVPSADIQWQPGEVYGDTLKKIRDLERQLRQSRRSPSSTEDRFFTAYASTPEFENIAGLETLPLVKMLRQIGRPFTVLYNEIQSAAQSLYPYSRRQVKEMLAPDPDRATRIIRRAQSVERVRQTWDPAEVQWQERMNRWNPAPRSGPAVPSFTTFTGVVRSLSSDLFKRLNNSGAIYGILGDISDYASENMRAIIRQGVREQLGSGVSREELLRNAVGGNVNTGRANLRSLVKEIIDEYEAERPNSRYQIRSAPVFNERDIFDQPNVVPGVQKDFEGAYLPSKLVRDYGLIASASLQGILPRYTEGMVASRPWREGDFVGGGAVRPIPVTPAAQGAAAASDAAAAAAQLKAEKDLELELLKIREDSLRPLSEQTTRLAEQNSLYKAQQDYIKSGITPALAEQYAQFDQLGELQRRIADSQTRKAVDEAQRQGATADRIAKLVEDHRQLNSAIDENVRNAKNLAAAYEAAQQAARFMQDSRIGLGFQEGAQAYVQSIGTMREATSQLAQTGIKGVEDAIFSLVTTGTANFQEFAKSILENTARMIIQQLILRSVMQIIGAIGGGGASAVNPLSNFNAGVAQYAPLANAMGNAYAANGIVPFAMGGVVKRPTMFAFANGGAGRLGLMGEAGPEAIMPLRRLPSGRLGVEAAGGGNAVKVDNITINVENSGEQLSPAAQKQIAGQVRGIVLATLVDQRRGGGVLR